MDDLISRQAAINMCRKPCMRNADCSDFEMEIMMLPSAEPYTIHSDGRLWITVDDIDKVTAVVVDEHKSKFCKQFYEDAEPDIIRCKDCKHWDGVDTCDVIDAPVWDNDFYSMAERRSDEE